MWICTNKGFISIVRDRNNERSFVVRARQKEHLTAVLGEVVIIETPHADYRWRAYIYDNDLVKLISNEIHCIQYDNFKNSVKDPDLHDAYADVWSMMYQLQRTSRKSRFKDVEV